MKKKLPKWICDIVLLAVAVFCIMPFVYMLLMSFKSTVNAYDISFSLSDFTLKQYKAIFTTGHFLRYL